MTCVHIVHACIMQACRMYAMHKYTSCMHSHAESIVLFLPGQAISYKSVNSKIACLIMGLLDTEVISVYKFFSLAVSIQVRHLNELNIDAKCKSAR